MIEHLEGKIGELFDLECISGEGSLLIFLPKSLAGLWGGSFALSEGNYSEPIFRWAGEGTPPTDYDRAADIFDYFKPIPLGNGQGIVITDDYATVWLPSNNGGTFLRLTGSSEELFPLISLIDETLWSEPIFEYRVDESNFVLFDPACRFTNDLEHFSIHLEPGNYRASSLDCKVEGFPILLHRLTRI